MKFKKNNKNTNNEYEAVSEMNPAHITKEQLSAIKKNAKRSKQSKSVQNKGIVGQEGGVVLSSKLLPNNNVELFYDNGQYHHLIIGSTGSGKTQRFIYPSILSIANTQGSMVINDPKGELFQKTAEYLRKQGYRVYAMDYVDPEAGTCFNQCFLIKQCYEEGLPHKYAAKASDVLIKYFEFIASGGKINNFKFFQDTTFPLAPTRLSDKLQQDVTYDRCTKGNSDKDPTHIFRIDSPTTDPKNDAYFKTYKALTGRDAIVKALKILTSAYKHAQDDFDKEKPLQINAAKYNNEYLLVRQKETIKHGVEILELIDVENIKYYYSVKLKQAEAKINSPSIDRSSVVYEQATMMVNKCSEIISDLSAPDAEITIPLIIDFLKDLKQDHELKFKECENEAILYATAIANILVYGSKKDGKSDPFWDTTAAGLIKGVLLLICRETHLPHSDNLASVKQIFTELTSQIKDTNPLVGNNSETTSLDRIVNRLVKGDGIKTAMTNYHNASDKTKQSILVSANAALEFVDDTIAAQIAYHEFDPIKLATEKTAVFLLTPGKDDSTSSNSILATIFIEETYAVLNKFLSSTKDLTLPRPVYFLLDEIGNIPAIPELGPKISLARSKNMRFNLVIQDYEQLQTLYKEGYETIRGQSNILYLMTSSYKTAKELEDRLGKTTINVTSTSSSDNKNGSSNSTSTSSTARPLMTADEIMKIADPTKQETPALYIQPGQNVYKTNLEYVFRFPIYTWLNNNKLQSAHTRRDNLPVNHFVPEPSDFTFAYESLERNVILDKYFYSELLGESKTFSEKVNPNWYTE